jgi:hypothetical protein
LTVKFPGLGADVQDMDADVRADMLRALAIIAIIYYLYLVS